MPNSSVELRGHNRYKISDKVIALSFDDVCRLTDISVGGAAIKCIGKSTLPTTWILDILMMEDNFHATIPVKLAWEKEVSLSPFSSVFTKCVGVQFDNLTTENKIKVDYLIKIHKEVSV